MDIGRPPVLLLDLDGVVVFETRESGVREILVLHQGLGAKLLAASQVAVVLTHRSRREAEHILRAAQLEPGHVLRLIAAEDLLKQACAGLHIGQLLGRGLQKSLALSLIERATGRGREDVAILDDRQHNLDAMLAAGAGLALKAPSACSPCGQFITTFDMDVVLRSLPGWHAEREALRQRDLPSVTVQVEPWRRSGLSTTGLDLHAFNRARRVVFAGRRYLLRRGTKAPARVP